MLYPRRCVSSAAAVTTTEAAQQRILDILKRRNLEAPQATMSLEMVHSGCKGNSYKFEPKQAPPPHFVKVAPRVCVPLPQLTDLVGLHIDWVDTDTESKFTFTNPQAKSTCSCGKSFATSKKADPMSCATVNP
ncbi:putative iron-sulfur cluster assembly accessory protein [Gregarina niphandrodes]|uniref:Iron-sulfur cluster assembly accessory protein n=1 Tax=Gregarina niphandrodes TaxID=110365 RepID=A0A023B7W5_GRENI|nr:putative iron-sulfur cluster assembly accessory protein [Gregarina niphandrodes]EZG68102.1 putative iron-sulfur cluster assembly accessory protein [Gregarina niphandrodes]|eukprot:XP_011130087.1 putative iron-sulfur cluster assembly accessory protein [Gregarina niphandrodes]